MFVVTCPAFRGRPRQRPRKRGRSVFIWRCCHINPPFLINLKLRMARRQQLEKKSAVNGVHSSAAGGRLMSPAESCVISEIIPLTIPQLRTGLIRCASIIYRH